MNLNKRLDRISRRPIPKDAVPLSSLAPLSKDDVRARGEDSLRRHMKKNGSSDAEIDAYLAETDTQAMAA